MTSGWLEFHGGNRGDFSLDGEELHGGEELCGMEL